MKKHNIINRPSFITIINDSKEDNAKARQETRWAKLFPGVNISFVGVSSDLGKNATLQAAGNLIDVLDAGEGDSGIVALNIAPRGDKNEKNGSQFAYFYYKDTLVISTTKDYNLSLVKKFGLVDQINLLDTEEVLHFVEQNNQITKELNNYITNTQFRSFDFQPRVVRWIFDDHEVPYTKTSISDIPDMPDCIWHIDSFGNYKTTLTIDDLAPPLKVAPFKVETNIGRLPYYERLKDVPSGELAIYTGSSGIEDQRFLEIAKQNTPGSAHKELNKHIGSKIEMYNK